jgi:hypothetical protein
MDAQVLTQQQINKKLRNQSYYIKNADKHKAYVKAKADENKEQISQHKKEYYQENKEAIVAKKVLNKEVLKQRDRERHALKKSELTDESKAKHKAYMLAYVECACGYKVQRSNSSTHRKTEKHKFIINLKNQINK